MAYKHLKFPADSKFLVTGGLLTNIHNYIADYQCKI